ncbi:MAG: Gfo/Idh/MocA family oxidoreductase [Kiritimatiellae bacterium]|nr:Gfo/Idh/MocA family oxidoreductase [Kiritimatiellia bacterium]
MLFQQVKDAQLVALQDPNPGALDKLINFLKTDEYLKPPHIVNEVNVDKIARFSNYCDMLDNAQLDAVFVLSPHTLHYEHIKAALERGLHVLVEKPFTCSVEQGKELIKLAKSKKRILMVSYQRHTGGVFKYMKDLIAQGFAGDISLVSAYQIQEGKVRIGTWRSDPKLAGGGQLNDSGSHLLAEILWITGLKMKEVYASVNNHGLNVDMTDALTVTFSNGARCSIGVSAQVNVPYSEELTIWGSKGAIMHRDGQLTLYGADGKAYQPDKAQFPASSRPEIVFVNAINGREALAEDDLRIALDTVWLTQSAYISSNQRKPVTYK